MPRRSDHEIRCVIAGMKIAAECAVEQERYDFEEMINTKLHTLSWVMDHKPEGKLEATTHRILQRILDRTANHEDN